MVLTAVFVVDTSHCTDLHTSLYTYLCTYVHIYPNRPFLHHAYVIFQMQLFAAICSAVEFADNLHLYLCYHQHRSWTGLTCLSCRTCLGCNKGTGGCTRWLHYFRGGGETLPSHQYGRLSSPPLLVHILRSPCRISTLPSWLLPKVPAPPFHETHTYTGCSRG